MSIPNELDRSYWEGRYQSHETGWDIGYASPALIRYCAKLEDKSIEILIPGCGYGHEVMELIGMGFRHITVIDLSHSALAALAAKCGDKARLVQGDFFEWEGAYDLIIEQTFFCAIDPHLRNLYVKKMHSLLKTKGRLMGVLFNREFEGGPPFGGAKEEYIGLFSSLFKICILAECYNSIPQRQGNELFMLLEKI